MKGLVSKIKNPKRKLIVLAYQENLENFLIELENEWSPMSQSQQSYLERTFKNIYYAPFFLGYAEHPNEEEKKKLEAIIKKDKANKKKELEEFKKMQEEAKKERSKTKEAPAKKEMVKKATPKKKVRTTKK
mgnify:CR=1 FL=1